MLRERDVFIRKNKLSRKTTKRKKKPLPHYKYAKLLEMRNNSNYIDMNKYLIRAIVRFLQNLTQLLATPETVAVPLNSNLSDDELFETPKRTIRHVSAETLFSDIKDEEEEVEDYEVKGNAGGKAYGDLDSPYLKQFLSTRELCRKSLRHPESRG